MCFWGIYAIGFSNENLKWNGEGMIKQVLVLTIFSDILLGSVWFYWAYVAYIELVKLK